MTTPLTPDELNQLKQARHLLTNQSLATRLQNAIGKPIALGIKWLPENWNDKVNLAAQAALKKALKVAIKSLDPNNTATERSNSNGLHKIMAAASGAAGGAFGLPALIIELPVSTTIIMRSIADIARAEGEHLTDIETRLACLEVFALGGTGKDDDYADTGYYAVRAVLAQQVTEAIKHLAQGGATHVTANPLARLIATIGSRFGIVVGEKAMAASIPILGAAGGAIINTLFIDHFQNVARGHFTIRRLERQYTPEIVKQAYDKL